MPLSHIFFVLVSWGQNIICNNDHTNLQYIYIYIVQSLQKQDTPQSQQNIESKNSAKRIFRAYSLSLYKLVKENVFFMTSSTLKLFQQIVNHELISY